MLLYHLSTPHDLAEALTAVCGSVIDSGVLKCTELRLAGNSAALNNDFPLAIAFYTEALDSNPAYGAHLLLSNRSAARLASGDAAGALADATAAVDCCPVDFSKAWIRQADALYALGRYQDALEAVRAAADKYKPFGETQEFVEIEKAIKKTLNSAGK
jgi:tetratricopeptide (TPR) repeat protein